MELLLSNDYKLGTRVQYKDGKKILDSQNFSNTLQDNFWICQKLGFVKNLKSEPQGKSIEHRLKGSPAPNLQFHLSHKLFWIIGSQANLVSL